MPEPRGARPAPPPLRGTKSLLILLFAAVAVPSARAAEPSLPVAEAAPLPESLRERLPDSVEDLRAIEERVRSLVDDLRAVTVAVRVGAAHGSGVIVSKDGYVMTAGHVSGRPGRPVTLTLNNGTRLEGVTLGRHREYDAGLIKITSRGDWSFAEVGDSADLSIGDWVIGTGHPGGYDRGRTPPVRLGRVLLKMRSVIQTDATLVGGDSGGPLFDLNGRVVGIHSRIGPLTAFNFHVPSEIYADGWDWLVAGQDRPVVAEPGGPLLGVSGEDDRGGCRLTRVSPDSPAEQAGLKEGDRVTRVDDAAVGGIEDLVAAVNEHEPGDRIRVTYERDGETHTATVTLAQRPKETDR